MNPSIARETRNRARESLAGLVGAEEMEVIWRDACTDAGVDGQSADLADLEKVADALMTHDSTVSLVGSSLSIRVRTYRMLHGADRLHAFLGDAP